jgi:hypothetical protein
MWLYKATGDEQYLNEAKKWFDPAPDWGMSWDDKVVACQVSHIGDPLAYVALCGKGRRNFETGGLGCVG